MDDLVQACIICNGILGGDAVKAKLGTKGCDGINKASTARGDSLAANPGEFVHIECRKKYCNPNNIKYDKVNSTSVLLSSPRTLRSVSEAFCFQNNCLFCGHVAKLSGKKRGLDVYPVRTLDFQTKIEEVCSQRKDDWADTIMHRLQSVHDLPAADALYHQTCSVNFHPV